MTEVAEAKIDQQFAELSKVELEIARGRKRYCKPTEMPEDVAVKGPDDLKTDERYPEIQEMLYECGLIPDLAMQWTVQQNKRKQDIFVGWVSDYNDKRHLVAVDYPKGVYHVPDDDPSKWNIGIGDKKTEFQP